MKSGPKTLVVLAPGFPKNEADTTCLPAQQRFIRQLRRCFPDLKVVILSFQYPETRKTYRWHQIPVVSFGIREGFYSRFRWVAVWRTIRRLERDYHLIGLLSFWYTECALLGTWYARIHHIPHYSWILGRDARKENRLPEVIRPRPEELISVSAFLAREFQKNHQVKPDHIIPTGVDQDLFTAHSPVRDIDLLGAGSLIPLKQYDLFIDTVGLVATDLPALKSVICGKGMQEADLRQQIDHLHLGQHVSLDGEKPHTEVISLMERTRVFLHPSAYEGFSGACLEALCAGAHVVSFCDPMGTKIAHWHVVHSNAEMQRKVLELLGDPGLDHHPVMPYSMEDSVRAVMRLFSQ